MSAQCYHCRVYKQSRRVMPSCAVIPLLHTLCTLCGRAVYRRVHGYPLIIHTNVGCGISSASATPLDHPPSLPCWVNNAKIDPSETKLLVVESMRFRVLEVDLQGLLSTSAPREKLSPSLANALGFCGEDESLPGGVRVFAGALPGGPFFGNACARHKL